MELSCLEISSLEDAVGATLSLTEVNHHTFIQSSLEEPLGELEELILILQ